VTTQFRLPCPQEQTNIVEG